MSDAPRELAPDVWPELPIKGEPSVTEAEPPEDHSTREVWLLVRGQAWIRSSGGAQAVSPHDVVIKYRRKRNGLWRTSTIAVTGPARREGSGAEDGDGVIHWIGGDCESAALPPWLAMARDTHRPTPDQGKF